MKFQNIYFLFITISAIGIVLLPGCKRNQNATQMVESKAKFSNSSIQDFPWGEHTYDAGRMMLGEKEEIDLDIIPKNARPVPPVVEQVAATCGCVHPEFAYVGDQSSPKIHLTATFEPNSEGKNLQVIRLLSAKKECLGLVKITAFAVSKFSLTTEVIDWGEVRNFSKARARVEIIPNSYIPKVWNILEAPKWIETKISPSKKGRIILTCNLKPETCPGPLEGKIRLRPDDNPSDDLSVLIKGYIPGDIFCIPSTLSLGPSILDGKIVTNFTLRKAHKEVVFPQVVALGLSPGESVTINGNPNNDDMNGEFTIKISSEKTVIRRGELVISSLKGNALLRIPYRVTILH